MTLSLALLSLSLRSATFVGGDWTWASIGIFAAATILLIYSYLRSPLRGFRRLLAVVLKALGIILLALILAEPVIIDKIPKLQSNDLAILVDNSASLSIPLSSWPEPPSIALRAALQGESPEQPPHWLAECAHTFRIQPFLVDRTLRSVPDFRSLDFDQSGTALGTALNQLVSRYRGRPLAAAVLLTDGNVTDPITLETFLTAQSALPQETRLPVFPVVVGELDSAARDLSLLRAEAITTQFEDAQVSINAEVEVLGDFPLPVEIYVINEKNEEIGKKVLTLPIGMQRRRATVRLQVAGVPPGVSFLTVGIRQITENPLPQLTELNDRRRIAVNRGRGPYRILYVSGRPNWEYKFLHRAISGDAELDLVALIRIALREPKFEWRGRPDEGSNPLFRGFNQDISEETQRYDEPVLIRLNTATSEELRDGFPKTAEDLFTHYRAIVIDDLEAEFFSAEQQELIERFVSMRGGTLIMLGGKESFQGGGWDNTPVGRVLPVYLDRLEAGSAALDASYQLSREGWLEDWLRLRVDRTEDEARLKKMPSFWAIHRIPAVKPGATVLATGKDDQGRELPALITQRYGEGRSAALAIADLWRWGMKDAEQQTELAKAWRQFLRWSVVDVPSRLEVTQNFSDESGISSAKIEARVRDLKFEPQDDAVVKLKIQHHDGTVKEISADPSLEEAGQFMAEYLSEDIEGYRIEVKAINAEGKEIDSAEVAHAWNHEAAEYAHLGPNSELLEKIAETTGGRMLRLDSLGQLPALLSQVDFPVSETREHPLWHSPWWFLLALGCFLGEWALRRRSGML